jgi:imidazolonepropionase-like amidohydrolase
MGLNIITGSDSSWGNYKLGNTVYETECLVHAGMSPMRGIVSLTSDAAKSLDIDDLTGSLEPGKEADVIVIDGNPVEDITALWKVADVFLAGQRVDRGPESLLSSIRQQPPASLPEAPIMDALASRE